MTDLDALYARNRGFASCFHYSKVPSERELSMVIVTCVDPRVFPGQFMRLEQGEAFVIRKPGGRVTADVKRDVAVLAALAREKSGGEGPPFELVIIQHTDCAMSSLADPEHRRQLAEATGLPDGQLERLAISDHAEAIREDIRRLRMSGIVPGDLVVSGHVYEIETGALKPIVGRVPLHASEGR